MKLKQVIGHQTTDGKQFFDIEQAKYHQSKIDVIAKVKKSDFSLTWKTEVSDLQIGDLSIIIELADIIKQSEQ